MNANCHFMYGLATGITISLITGADMNEAIGLTSSCLIGSLLPDIDMEKSTISNLLKPISIPIYKLNSLFGASEERHRGIIHDLGLWTLLLILSLSYFPSWKGFFIGGLSHLLLDLFNPAGVPFLFIRRIRIGTIKSGSRDSIILTLILSILLITFGILYHFGLVTLPKFI